MATRREEIEALLRVRDLARFKTSMRSASGSLKDFGEEGLGAAERFDILERAVSKVEKKALEAQAAEQGLRHETKQTGEAAVKAAAELLVMDKSVKRLGPTARLAALEHALGKVDRKAAEAAVSEKALEHETKEVGRQALETSADIAVMNHELNRLRSVLAPQLTNWRFWKDRLSLTSGEVKSTAITMASYLSPALLEVGASAGAALLGGGLVAGGGIAALTVGLGGLALVGKTVVGQFKKIQTAQLQYNLAIQQYGKTSVQAQRAANKLYAVIQQNGGTPVWRAVKAVTSLKNAWAQSTLGARSNLANMLTSSIHGARRLLPTFAQQTNLNTTVFSKDWARAMHSLSGNETKKTIVSLSSAFRQMSGPLMHGAVNLIFVLMRYLRAAAPYAVKLANAFEHWTQGLRRSSSDRKKVNRDVAMLVGHAKDWWNLFKALGRLVVVVFGGTQKGGANAVVAMTRVINRFDDWLSLMNKKGKTQHFFSEFNRQLGLLFTDPKAFVDSFLHTLSVVLGKALPFIINWVTFTLAPNLAYHAAIAFGQIGFKVATSFLNGFIHAPILSQLFLLGFLFKRQIFILLGGKAALAFGEAFIGSMLAGGTVTKMGAVFGANGALVTAAANSGRLSGAAFASAFARVIPITLLVYVSYKTITKVPGILKGAVQGLRDLASPSVPGMPTGAFSPGDHGPHQRYRGGAAPSLLPTHKKAASLGLVVDPRTGMLVAPPKRHRAMGGNIPWGASALVGELGPEVATATPSGLNITPNWKLNSKTSGLRSQTPTLSVSDLLPPVHVHIEVQRKEIGHAYIDWRDEKKSLRGELPDGSS